MNKLIRTLGALTIAVALLTGFTACSNEDLLDNPVHSTQSKTIHVTVGAGINDAQTRSEVDYNTSTKKRTLKFTDGDRLYVRAIIKSENDILGQPQEKYIMAGYLSIASIGANGTSATFTGDLDVFEGNIVTEYYEEWVVTGEHYEQQEVEVGYDESGPIYELQDVLVEDGMWVPHYDQPTTCYINSYNTSSYAFTEPNPLDECEYAIAVLVHKDADTHFSVDDDTKYWDYTGQVATDVATLMTTFFLVQGEYQSQTFTLQAVDEQPILNCAISGLTAGATYNVKYMYGDNSYSDNEDDLSSFTADAQGKISFAFIGCSKDDFYHAISFVNDADGYDWKLVNLGQKTLQNKVYNVTKTAVDDPAAPKRPIKPTLSRSDGLNADDLILGDEGLYFIYGTGHDNGTPDDDSDDYWDGDINMSISGNSTGYCFYLCNGGTVTLGGNGTAYYDNGIFIYGYYGNDLTIMLNSDYTINCKCGYAIATGSNLKLGVTSGTKKLTITVNNTDYKGLCADNYYVYDHYDDINFEDVYRLENPSVLAAQGCTVTLESETDNQDGTYTYVYTVTKN